MSIATPDFAKLKSGPKASWIARDFGQIANVTAAEAEKFVKRLGIESGARLLDVAGGTGNTAIPASRAGASVTGVDIAPNLLLQSRKRAAAEGLEIEFDEVDAEQLPFSDHSFDVVLTMFGATLAPRPSTIPQPTAQPASRPNIWMCARLAREA